jgi:hypothetical protein
LRRGNNFFKIDQIGVMIYNCSYGNIQACKGFRNCHYKWKGVGEQVAHTNFCDGWNKSNMPHPDVGRHKYYDLLIMQHFVMS